MGGEHLCYIVVQEQFHPERKPAKNIKAFADADKAILFAKNLFGSDLDGVWDDYYNKGVSMRHKVFVDYVELDLT